MLLFTAFAIQHHLAFRRSGQTSSSILPWPPAASPLQLGPQWILLSSAPPVLQLNSANASVAPLPSGPLPVGPHGSARPSSGTSATTVTLTAEQWAAIQSTLDQNQTGPWPDSLSVCSPISIGPTISSGTQSPERSSRRNSHHTRRDSRSRSPGHYHRRRSPSRDYSNRRYDGASRPLLKPKVSNIYKGSSHKELHEFARQCHEYFKNCTGASR